MKLFSKSSNQEIFIEKEPFAGGAEGNLYHIILPAELKGKKIVKIYHENKLSPERKSKLEFLYAHPPVDFEVNEHSTVIWPEDLLKDDDDVLKGFIMPFVSGKKLELLCSPKLKAEHNAEWGRFSFDSSGALNLRLKLCFNLAVAIYLVHRTEQFVLVDLKPDNVIVQPNGLLSLVDMDSVEIIAKGKTLFDAKVATPEYTPAEFYRRMELDYDPTAKIEWDLFSMAVIFYKLLLGLHPFAGANSGKFENHVTLEQKIEAGLFVHHPNANDFMSVTPPPHKAFNKLTAGIQELFLRCFTSGHVDPETRPDAEEWCVNLLDAIEDEKMKARYSHLFSLTLFEIDNSSQRIPASYYYSDLKLGNVLTAQIYPQGYHYVPQTLAAIPKTISNYFPLIKKRVQEKENQGFFERLMSNEYANDQNSLKLKTVERILEIYNLYPVKVIEFEALKAKKEIFESSSAQKQWGDFLKNTVDPYLPKLKLIDEKIIELSNEENKHYAELMSDFTAEVKMHELFGELTGSNSRELRVSLEKTKDIDLDWDMKLKAFNRIAFKHHMNYLNERRKYDQLYKSYSDEAKKMYDEVRTNVLSELNRLQYVLRHETKFMTEFKELEIRPKVLDSLYLEFHNLIKEFNTLNK